MDNQELDIEALKKDSEFSENLKRLEREMNEQQSIAKGYQLLDAKLVIEAEEDEINRVFTFIVNSAFDKLSDYLTAPQKFELSDSEDWAAARAIYEHGIQRYSENDQKGAKEIFLVLYHMITDHEIRDAMMIHACAVMAGHSFDRFVDELTDVSSVDPTDPMAFFITTFAQPTDELLVMFAEQVRVGKEEIKVLEASQ